MLHAVPLATTPASRVTLRYEDYGLPLHSLPDTVRTAPYLARGLDTDGYSQRMAVTDE